MFKELTTMPEDEKVVENDEKDAENVIEKDIKIVTPLKRPLAPVCSNSAPVTGTPSPVNQSSESPVPLKKSSRKTDTPGLPSELPTPDRFSIRVEEAIA